ncbi:MAG: transglutaminase domain-containing protein [Myxococcales bacterium]|nr:transglutaminase domain-containing protein [Myxococcales bacterium]
MRSAWDIVGLASLLVFGGSLYALNEGTEAARLATPVELGTATELQAGDEWLGLYFGEQKVGLTHIHKERREAGGWEYEYRTSLKLDVAGTGLSIDLEVHVDLSDLLAVESFTFALETGAQKFRGEGKVTDRTVDLRLNLGGERVERRLELPEPPVLKESLGPLLSQRLPPKGERLSLSTFDPFTMSEQLLVIETIGPDSLVVMGQEVPVTHIRQTIAGSVLDAWVTSSGELLRQELPLGLVARRETEEEARWGMAGERIGARGLLSSVELELPGLPPRLGERPELRLRVKGLDASMFPQREPRQSVDGETVTIRREPVGPGLPRQARETRSEAGARDVHLQVRHPKIRALATELSEGALDSVEVARRIVAFLQRELTVERSAGVPTALEVLETRRGDCNEFAVLFAALARASGVSVRLVFGLVYRDGRLAYHAWNEVGVEGGWLSVDPLWNQVPADVGHLMLSSGELDAQGVLLRAMGRIRVELLPPLPTSN